MRAVTLLEIGWQPSQVDSYLEKHHGFAARWKAHFEEYHHVHDPERSGHPILVTDDQDCAYHCPL